MGSSTWRCAATTRCMCSGCNNVPRDSPSRCGGIAWAIVKAARCVGVVGCVTPAAAGRWPAGSPDRGHLTPRRHPVRGCDRNPDWPTARPGHRKRVAQIEHPFEAACIAVVHVAQAGCGRGDEHVADSIRHAGPRHLGRTIRRADDWLHARARVDSGRCGRAVGSETAPLVWDPAPHVDESANRELHRRRRLAQATLPFRGG